MRQQNWMKSFRSQRRLDFTISQNVSSAGGAEAGEKGGMRQAWGPVQSFQPPHCVGPMVRGDRGPRGSGGGGSQGSPQGHPGDM